MASNGSERAHAIEYNDSSNTIPFFCTALLWSQLGFLQLWPIIEARGPSCPLFLASAFAAVCRTGGSFLFAIPFVDTAVAHDLSNTHAIVTRGQMTALIGGTSSRTTMLLGVDHLHVFLLILLFGGGALHTLMIVKRRRLLMLLLNLAVILSTMAAYACNVWLALLERNISEALWQYRGISAIYVSALWFILHLAAWPLHRRSRGNKPTGRSFILTLPKLFSTRFALIAALVLLATFFLLHDPGFNKEGRIVIDEAHSEWEKSDIPIDSEHYGVRTVYNYSFLREILKRHFTSVEVNYSRLTDDNLAECDVLILKTPTRAYDDEEVAAVRSFVEQGGGVWLIGDHTNIFGMNTYLNQIGSNWEIYFNADAISPLPTYYQQIVQIDGVPPVHRCGNREHENLYSRRYLNHPIVGHHVPYLAVLTSCSVSAPWMCDYVSISRGTFADHARFGSNTFFGNLKHDADERYGSILQNVALRSGRGRIAVWSDSTLFSNFSMCMTGVPNLALGYVNWLNHENAILPKVRHTVLIVLAIAIVTICVFGRMELWELAFSGVVAATVVSLAIPVIDQVNSLSYQQNDISKGFRSVGFDQQYSNLDLPNKDHVHDEDVHNFETLYVQVQRLRMMPISGDRFSTLSSCDAIVVTNPRSLFSAEDVQKAKASLRSGRSLILILGRSGISQSQMMGSAKRFNHFLNQLGVPEKFVVRREPELTDFYGALVEPGLLTDLHQAAAIEKGGSDIHILLRSSDQSAVVSATQVGRGTVYLCAIGEHLSNASLGAPGTVPDTKQALLLRLCHRLFTAAAQE